MFKDVFIDGARVSNDDYKVYTAIIRQSSTDAPIATILGNNTIGDIIWTRTGQGSALATLIGAFPIGKTFFSITNNFSISTGFIAEVEFNNTTQDSFAIELFDLNGVAQDIWEIHIEIRIYS